MGHSHSVCITIPPFDLVHCPIATCAFYNLGLNESSAVRSPKDYREVTRFRCFSIGMHHQTDNTDDVGLFLKRWVLTPPKVLGKILADVVSILFAVL